MKPIAMIAAAALAAGGFGYVGCDRNETATNTTTTGQPRETVGDKVDRAMDRAGDAAGNVTDKAVEAGKDAGAAISDGAQRAGAELRGVGQGTAKAPDAEGIRDILASVTEAALTENGLNDVTERLVDADRNRIGKSLGGDFPEHAALVQQFRADWKAKYGQDFDIKQEQATLPDTMFTVTQGEVAPTAAGAEVDVDRDADGGATVDVDRKSGVDSPDTTAADANRNDPGRNIASVAVQASHGMPALTVPLIHEAPDNWRIDAPDTLDGEKLKQNVLAHLQAAHGMKDQWPDNVRDAYAAVTHHVLMAVLDRPAK